MAILPESSVAVFTHAHGRRRRARLARAHPVLLLLLLLRRLERLLRLCLLLQPAVQHRCVGVWQHALACGCSPRPARKQKRVPCSNAMLKRAPHVICAQASRFTPAVERPPRFRGMLEQVLGTREELEEGV